MRWSLAISLLFCAVTAQAQTQYIGFQPRGGGGGGGSSPGTANLVSAYEFSTGALLTDAHGTDNLTNGNGLGGAVCTSDNVIALLGYAADCNGNDEWMGLTNANATSFLFGDVDFTFAIWRYGGIATGFAFKGFGIYDNGNSYRLRFRDTFGGNIRWTVSDGTTTTDRDGDGSNTFTANTWHFIVVSHDATANEICLEIDNSGSPVCTAHTAGANGASSAGFYIGTNDAGTGTTGSGSGESIGYWDQFFIFNDILTTDEKTWLYNSGSGRAYSEL